MNIERYFNIMRIVIIAVIGWIMTGCATQRRTTPEVITIHERDTVRIETVIETTLKPDTVFITIPAQRVERTTADSTSFLENDFAWSKAIINADGTLFHVLNTKTGAMPFEVMVPTTNRTTKGEHVSYIEKPVPVRVPVEVEREISWWEHTCITFAPWLFMALIGTVCFIFRKPLMNIFINLARKFIGSK